MSRPLYEGPGDRANEHEVIEAFTRSISRGFHKLPMAYVLDYAITNDDRVTGFIEVKCRSNKHDAYPTIFVSLHKYERACSFMAAGLPCHLLVRWSDRVGHISMDRRWYIGIGGRTDRGDSADVEPVVHYKIENVKFMEAV